MLLGLLLDIYIYIYIYILFQCCSLRLSAFVLSEVGGVRAALALSLTGKTISIALAFALRACVRAKLRERDDMR